MIKTFLTITHFSLLMLACMSALTAQMWTETQKIVSTPTYSKDGFGKTIVISGNYMFVGNYRNTVDTNSTVYVFKYNNQSEWVMTQAIKMHDKDSISDFGYSIAASGNYLLVGDWGERNDTTESNWLNCAGAAYVFELDQHGKWVLAQKLVASDRQAFDFFGYSVSISNNYAIIGATSSDKDSIENCGAVYIFERKPSGHWCQTEKIMLKNPGKDDALGCKVAIDDGYAIAAAKGSSTGKKGDKNYIYGHGAVIFLKRDSNGKWQILQEIEASDKAMGDHFGEKLFLNKQFMAVASPNATIKRKNQVNKDHTGAVYMFKLQGDRWKEIQKITTTTNESYEDFGSSISIDSTNMVIGSSKIGWGMRNTEYIPDAGAVFVYTYDGTLWKEVQKIIATDRKEDDRFGVSVVIKGIHIMVGAFQADETSSNNCGRVYLFRY